MGEPTRVGEILAAVPGMAERLREARLIAAWPALAGAAGPRSRAERVERGVLHVAVASSAWLHRLTLEEPRLRERCRAVADIHAIRFHLGLGTGPNGSGADEPHCGQPGAPAPADTDHKGGS
jgi:hypothetical protein